MYETPCDGAGVPAYRRDMEPEFSTVSNGRARLHVATWGAGDRTILALHPGVGDSRIWQWCAPAWATAGFRVIAYDRRGFGSTVCTPEPHDDLSDLLAVMDATASDAALIVGNSRGGGLAIDLALSSHRRVSALVLVAPSAFGYDFTDWPTAAAEAEQDLLVIAAEEAEDLELVNRLEARYWLDGVEQSEGRVGGEPRELFLEMNGRALRVGTIGEGSAGPPAWPILPQIDVPVLVVAGEFDLPGIRRRCAEIAASIVGSEFIEMPDSAHCPSLDRPDKLSRLVLDFVAPIATA